MNSVDPRRSFRLGVVPGVTPTRWLRTWRERFPEIPLDVVELNSPAAAGAVRAGEADAALARIPVPMGSPEVHVIPLYQEDPVVVVPTDHYLCAADEVECADFAGETVLHPQEEAIDWGRRVGKEAHRRPTSTAVAVALVAAGAGVLVVPKSLARRHHRKDVTFRPITDLPKPEIGLVWVHDGDLMDGFIGIVRGRTVNSSRAGSGEPRPKLTASQKAAARRERLRNQRGGAPQGEGRKQARSAGRRSPRRGGR